MLWGGRRLPAFLGRDGPDHEPIGEAWVLSDVDGNLSRVANGHLAGRTLRELIAEDRKALIGSTRLLNGRFPLLLKFIDAQQELSVQVHPDDAQAAAKKPDANGKTEAWVILEANPATSFIYAGFAEGITRDDFLAAMQTRTTPRTLHRFRPSPGDCVFLRAGTVHAIGADILLFEIQQTSDITYRLYDWDRIDAKTGQGRELHIEDGLACANFSSGPCRPVAPPVEVHHAGRREGLVACEHFTLERQTIARPFVVPTQGRCRVLVAIEGGGQLEYGREHLPLKRGDVLLLPAVLGECVIHPAPTLTFLECGLPENNHG